MGGATEASVIPLKKQSRRMIRIAITQAAFDAIVATMPSGSASYEAERSESGKVFVWLEPRIVDKLKAARDPGESYSDPIVRLAKGGA